MSDLELNGQGMNEHFTQPLKGETVSVWDRSTARCVTAGMSSARSAFGLHPRRKHCKLRFYDNGSMPHPLFPSSIPSKAINVNKHGGRNKVCDSGI